MKTWDEYKKYAKSMDPGSKEDMEEVEELASIVGAAIAQRHNLGMSQRDLAALCEIPQSSIARIESFRTIPNLITMIKIMQQLNLKITVSQR